MSKLNEAKALVDELKRRAAEQSALLKTKQQEADSALQEITTSMQVREFRKHVGRSPGPSQVLRRSSEVFPLSAWMRER